ncbi:MAG: hypothetical protein M1399_03725 [Actinobacteria bacterium]|nr:hypothetical protein [Actinomycetota bacterium]MCL5447498.1 hypothetical protein [Actinomycetota bacterium]
MDTLEIIRQMRSDPALAEEMRAIVLDDEIRSLPAIVNRLADSVEAFRISVEAFRISTEKRLDALEKATTENSKAIAENSKAIAENSKAIAENSKAIAENSKTVNSQGKRLDRMDGELQEINFRDNVENILYEYIDSAKLISKKEIDQLIAKAEQSMQNEARKRLFKADAVVVGKERNKTSSKIYGVVEVSSTVGTDDVTRAKRGADLLGCTGSRTMAVVVGREITREAQLSCENRDAVFVSTDKTD